MWWPRWFYQTGLASVSLPGQGFGLKEDQCEQVVQLAERARTERQARRFEELVCTSCSWELADCWAIAGKHWLIGNCAGILEMQKLQQHNSSEVKTREQKCLNFRFLKWWIYIKEVNLIFLKKKTSHNYYKSLGFHSCLDQRHFEGVHRIDNWTKVKLNLKGDSKIRACVRWRGSCKRTLIPNPGGNWGKKSPVCLSAG